MSCDIIPSEGFFNHYQGDILDIIHDGWDMMIAFPPCTHLAVSGARHFEQKRRDGRQQKAIEFFMNLANAPIRKICLENPIGIMSSIYRKPDQIVHPYYFGDPIPKSTCLWLKNLPPLIHFKEVNLFYEPSHVDPHYIEYNSAKTVTGKSRYSVLGKLGKGKGKERSKFHYGIAQAMADQWG